jgi:DNA invertase Pin-like site-specific DNA recombinase
MKLGLYARVSTHEQQTLALQRDAMAAYAQQRQGTIVLTVAE